MAKVHLEDYFCIVFFDTFFYILRLIHGCRGTTPSQTTGRSSAAPLHFSPALWGCGLRAAHPATFTKPCSCSGRPTDNISGGQRWWQHDPRQHGGAGSSSSGRCEKNLQANRAIKGTFKGVLERSNPDRPAQLPSHAYHRDPDYPSCSTHRQWFRMPVDIL